MGREELRILEELRHILNSKNEAVIILGNYFKGGVGKSESPTMFAYLTNGLNSEVLMINKDLQATLIKDSAKTFKVELPCVNLYEGLKNGDSTSSIIHLTDNLDLTLGTLDLMLLPKLTRLRTFENRGGLLVTLLAPLKSDYGLVIIDTVPTPNVHTNNIVVVGDHVMIPLQTGKKSTNNIQNYIIYLIDLQEQFNLGLDMISFAPYLVDTDSMTIKSNLEELYKQHKEDNLVFQNIIERSSKVSTWSKNGITKHKGYDKKVLSMYENVFFEMVERIIQLENEEEQNHRSQVIAGDEIRIRRSRRKRVTVGNLGAQKARRNDTPISAKKDIMVDKTVRVYVSLHHIMKIETAENGGDVKEVMDQALEEYIRKYLPNKL